MAKPIISCNKDNVSITRAITTVELNLRDCCYRRPCRAATLTYNLIDLGEYPFEECTEVQTYLKTDWHAPIYACNNICWHITTHNHNTATQVLSWKTIQHADECPCCLIAPLGIFSGFVLKHIGIDGYCTPGVGHALDRCWQSQNASAAILSSTHECHSPVKIPHDCTERHKGDAVTSAGRCTHAPQSTQTRLGRWSRIGGSPHLQRLQGCQCQMLHMQKIFVSHTPILDQTCTQVVTEKQSYRWIHKVTTERKEREIGRGACGEGGMASVPATLLVLALTVRCQKGLAERRMHHIKTPLSLLDGRRSRERQRTGYCGA